jgi:hypothetical protein
MQAPAVLPAPNGPLTRSGWAVWVTRRLQPGQAYRVPAKPRQLHCPDLYAFDVECHPAAAALPRTMIPGSVVACPPAGTVRSPHPLHRRAPLQPL